jgi:hypothetical protein
MSEISVGKEVLSYCGKCKLTLAHMIVAMKDDTTIAKVKCKTCQATHAYKDPSKVRAKKSLGTSSNSSTRSTRKKDDHSISDIWMSAINKSTAKSQPYSPKTCFTNGDIIDHVKFGPGVVEKLLDGNKIEVIFRHEIKTLMHNLK